MERFLLMELLKLKLCNMKRTFIFGSILCFFVGVNSLSLLAQEYKNFDLSKYITPDIKRSRLDFGFDSNGKFADNFDTEKSSLLFGQLNSSFESIKNTRKKITSLNLNLNLNGKYTGSKSDVYTNNISNSFNFQDGLSVLYIGKYFNSSNYFISVGTNFRMNNQFVNYNKKSDLILEQKSHNTYSDYGLTPSIGIGFGRIESVEDARQVLYLIKGLSKNGALNRELSVEETFQLAQKMSSVKNKRFLDSRLRKIDEITSIDSFLVDNNLIQQSDARYFTILYDIWENGALFQRKSGHAFELKIEPGIGFRQSKDNNNWFSPDSTYWYNSTNKSYGANLSFNYNLEKPVNLNWQHSVRSSIGSSSYSYLGNSSQSSSQNENSSNFNTNALYLNGSYSIGYFPTTRTNLVLGIDQYFTQRFSKTYLAGSFDSVDWSKDFNSYSRLNFSIYYYLSPQFRISGSTSIDYGYSNYITNKSNRFSGEFQATISYSLF